MPPFISATFAALLGLSHIFAFRHAVHFFGFISLHISPPRRIGRRRFYFSTPSLTIFRQQALVILFAPLNFHCLPFRLRY
jgi:hypothetical protein